MVTNYIENHNIPDLNLRQQQQTLFSYIKYTNITPPANSKANRGRWCVDGLRFFTIVDEMNNKVPYL